MLCGKTLQSQCMQAIGPIRGNNPLLLAIWQHRQPYRNHGFIFPTLSILQLLLLIQTSDLTCVLHCARKKRCIYNTHTHIQWARVTCSCDPPGAPSGTRQATHKVKSHLLRNLLGQLGAGGGGVGGEDPVATFGGVHFLGTVGKLQGLRARDEWPVTPEMPNGHIASNPVCVRLSSPPHHEKGGKQNKRKKKKKKKKKKSPSQGFQNWNPHAGWFGLPPWRHACFGEKKTGLCLKKDVPLRVETKVQEGARRPANRRFSAEAAAVSGSSPSPQHERRVALAWRRTNERHKHRLGPPYGGETSKVRSSHSNVPTVNFAAMRSRAGEKTPRAHVHWVDDLREWLQSEPIGKLTETKVGV